MRASSAVEDVTSGRTADEARDRDAEAGQARRDQETADRIGAETLAEAGFNPDGTPRRGGARGRRAGGSGGGSGRSAMDRALEENAPLKAEAQRLVDESADIQAMFAAQRAAEEAKNTAQRAVDEAARLWEQGTREQQEGNTQGKTSAQRAVDAAAGQLERRRSLSEQFRAILRDERTEAERTGESINNVFRSAGDAMAEHLSAAVAGRESFGQAMEGMAQDAIKAVGDQAKIRSAFEFVAGLASLAVWDLPGAAQHFAAGAGFAVVAGLAGLAAPSPPAKGGGASSDQRAAPVSDRQRASGASGQGTVVNVNVSGFVVGSAGEVARQLTNVLRLGYDQAGVTIPQRAVG
jgi:hypothetical protein